MANPYQAPSARIDLVSESQARLVAVARYQRWLNLVMLGNIAIIIVALGVDDGGPPQASVGFVWMILTFAAIAAVFLLARAATNLVLALLCGFLMLVPCLNVLVMLVLSWKATGTLRKAGVRVGLLGASEKAVRQALAPSAR